MTLTIENIFLVSSILLFLSIIAGKTTYKFGVPTLILFLAIGMLAGSDGIGKIHFDDPKIAQFIGIVSLNFILFSGGLDTRWSQVKPVMGVGIVLSTVGVLLTAISLGLFVYWITELSIYESLLLGGIVSSTDAAAVFSLLRSKSLSLRFNLRPTLELESGSNDPMAYVLTIGFLSLVVQPEKDLWTLFPMVLKQMVLGGVLGYAFGTVSKIVVNSIKLDFEGLYPVLMIACMFLTFSFTDSIGGNGFLAIYIAAVYLGNHDFIHKKSILQFYDGVAWLVQIVLFLTLGLLVYPTHILPVIERGLLISLFLIFIGRPVSVFLSTMMFKLGFRHRLYLSWVGLRGAVPIVFATYPLIEGIHQAEMIFNLVFFISITSVMIQGTTLSIVAKWLGVAFPSETQSSPVDESLLSEFPRKHLNEITVLAKSRADGKAIVDLEIPHHIVIALISRNGGFITPKGSTVLEVGDRLYLLSNNTEDLERARRILEDSFDPTLNL